MHGAVIFDDDTKPRAGWASVAGKAAFRISAINELASDVYWWTNLSAATFAGAALRSDCLKRFDYLRPNMKQLHAELGLASTKDGASRNVEISSEVFDRVMRLARSNYGLQHPEAHSLADDLHTILVQADPPYSGELEEALREAYTPYVQCQTTLPVRSTLVAFRRPRVEHASAVLNTPVPTNEWELLDDRALPPDSERVNWLLKQSRPVLSKVSVRVLDPEIGRLVAFSTASERRRWVSHPELLTLSRFCKVKVEKAYLASRYESYGVAHGLFTGGQLGLLSLSVGILAENYWYALAVPRCVLRHATNNSPIYTARGAWYCASDRFMMLMPALTLQASGFVPRGYGRGLILVAVPKGAMSDMKACAAAAGLVAPLQLAELEG